jgi:hypothetical protein
MRLKVIPWIVGLLLCLLSVAGCRNEDAIDPQGNGYVEANHAYEENFGAPPQGDRGNAFARVAYLPLHETPEKLRALPVFLFTDEDQLRKILERLISGELLVQRDSALYNPFPGDLAMRLANQQGPVATISLTTHQAWAPGDLLAGSRALAETALQFATLERVIILLDGRPVPQMPAGGFSHDQELLVRVEPPALVMIAGVWEQGSDAPREILVEFDRPIKVKSFELSTGQGHPVAGEYFTSIFRMAVIVHPDDPGRYREGSMLRAEWEVVDELGRDNRGTTTLPLRRLDH